MSGLFELQQERDLWLLQPAFSPLGKTSWDITRARWSCSLRFTDFVELTCPLFRKDKLDTFMGIFDPVLTGTGTDWWFMDSLGRDIEGKVAIIDSITCINPSDRTKGGVRECRPAAVGAQRTAAWDMVRAKYGVDRRPQREFGRISKRAPARWLSPIAHWPVDFYARALKLRVGDKTSDRKAVASANYGPNDSIEASIELVEASEHTSELGQWQTAQRPADPRLRAYVHGYFASSSHLRMPVQERHVASIEVPLLLNFGAPHRRLDALGSGEWTARDGVWVVGLHNRHQLTQAAGERHFMVVRFTPIGAHLFLGLPMHLIANEALDLALIDPALARALVSRVGVARSWPERFAAMESLIAERVADAEIPGSVDFAWRRLVATDGRIALGALAAEVDCSHRALIARFRTCVGFPPKTIARLLRFNRAVRSLDRLSGLRRR